MMRICALHSSSSIPTTITPGSSSALFFFTIFFFFLTAGISAAMSTPPPSKLKVIDSHLHVWANSQESSNGFPYADGQDPPSSLKDVACVDALLEKMDASDVHGALIVQPINHKFDHSYLAQKAIAKYPNRFKGMMLYDPKISNKKDAIEQLEILSKQGFVGVRYNPYLWPKLGDQKWSPMSEGIGAAVYKRCGELNLPVGVMCFNGLSLHYDDMVRLLEQSPSTTMIIDHYGFTSIYNDDDDDTESKEAKELAFKQLLSLGQKYSQVVVKVSAPFRLNDEYPFKRIREERFMPLLKTFGSNRMMFGTDFPFVVEQQGGYSGAVELSKSWIIDDDDLNTNYLNDIMGGTAERLKW